MYEFYRTELDRALSEQRYGVISYLIDNEACTSHVAFATVYLLEQQQIRVQLSNRGYEEHGNQSSIDSESQVFEALEDLLSARSLMYSRRRAEELQAKLLQLAGFNINHTH